MRYLANFIDVNEMQYYIYFYITHDFICNVKGYRYNTTFPYFWDVGYLWKYSIELHTQSAKTIWATLVRDKNDGKMKFCQILFYFLVLVPAFARTS